MITFGPIPSRRLGKSLGINNIVSPKSCSFACIYCQVGKTYKKTITRDSFYEPEVILEKVYKHIDSLNQENQPDYLTLVSNGEPTLDINLGKTILKLKETGIPVAVITNASLLYDQNVRDDLSSAEWVSLKIDAANETIWRKINQPSDELNYDQHIKNIISFASEYKGTLCTESMITDGVNDSETDFKGIAEIVKQVNPDTAYLSVPIRPPANKSVKAPDQEKLNSAWHIFTDMSINTELLNMFEGTVKGFTGNIYEDVLNITAVHPLREDSLINLLKRNKADFMVVESMIKQKLIRSSLYNGSRFYMRAYHGNI